jgi:hypothetical protein
VRTSVIIDGSTLADRIAIQYLDHDGKVTTTFFNARHIELLNVLVLLQCAVSFLLPAEMKQGVGSVSVTIHDGGTVVTNGIAFDFFFLLAPVV